MQSRWALSYLRGPLGRDEIKRLSAAGPVSTAAQATPRAVRARRRSAGVAAGGGHPADCSARRAAVLRAGRRPRLVGSRCIYGAADVTFVDKKLKIDLHEARHDGWRRLPTPRCRWTGQNAEAVDLAPEVLVGTPPRRRRRLRGAPGGGAQGEELRGVEQAVRRLACRQPSKSTLFRHAASGQTSLPDETERDFRARLAADGARGSRSQDRRAAEEVRAQAGRARREAAPREAGARARAGAVVVAEDADRHLVRRDAGRRACSAGVRSRQARLGRATTAARGVGRAQKEAQDVSRARRRLRRSRPIASGSRTTCGRTRRAIDPVSAIATEPLESVVVKPKKTGVTVKLVALVWR